MGTTNIYSSYAWRSAVAGALLVSPLSLAMASHYAAALSGGKVTQFMLDVGVVSTTGPYLWPLSWLSGILGGVVAGGLAAFIAARLGGERGARLGLLLFGLVAGAALGWAIGSLSQDVATTITAGPQSLVSEHHAMSAKGRHPSSVGQDAWTAIGAQGSDLAMKVSVSRRPHWGMLAFSIPCGALIGMLTARGLTPPVAAVTGS